MSNVSGSAPSRPSSSAAIAVILVRLLIVVCLGYLYPSPYARAQTEPATGMTGAPMVPAGLQVPSTYRISLEGTVDTQPFGPLTGTLQIMPSAPGDPNPLAVSVSTEALDTQGSISWSSFTPRRVGPGAVNGTITAAPGQVRMEIQPSATPRAELGWFTQSRDPLLPAMLMGVTVQSGLLTIAVHDTHVSGEIHGTGVSDVQHVSSYRARFTGEQDEKNAVSAFPSSQSRRFRAKAAVRAARNQTIAGIESPGEFTIALQGTADDRPFGPLAGTLDVSPSAPDDPNPFSVTFMTTMIDERWTHGSILWASFDKPRSERPGQVQSTITIEANGQVRLEVMQSDKPLGGPSYSILPQGKLPSDPLAMVHIERGTLTFTIEGDQVSGTIKASGVFGPDLQQLSTYEAHFTGYKPDRSLPTLLAKTTLTSRDALALRHTGESLLTQGKCEEAMEPLRQALQYYRAERQKKGQSFLHEDVIINEARAVTVLLQCAFQVGRYEELVQHAQSALEAQQLLNPTHFAQRIFAQVATELDQQLAHHFELLDTFQANLLALQAALQEALQRTGVGIQFAQEEKSQDVVITGLAKEGPAFAAGVRVGDVIVRVDDHNTQGMTPLEVVPRIRGPVGTQVVLTVRRGDRPLDFTLTRARIPLHTVRTPDELFQAFQALGTILEAMRLLITDDRSELQTLQEHIATGQQNPSGILENLPTKLTAWRQALIANVREVADLGKETFREQEKLLKAVSFLIASISFDRCEDASNLDLKRLDALEKDIIHALKQNENLSDIEKDFFGEQMKISVLQTTSFEFLCRSDFITRLEISNQVQRRLERALQEASHFREYFEQWRKKLRTDEDKRKALEGGKPFFQALVLYYLELNKPEEALVASETARARAFVDLLAGRAEVRKALEERPWKVEEGREHLPSPTTVPALTLQEILALVKQRHSTTLEYFLTDTQLIAWVIPPTGREDSINFISMPLDRQKLQESIATFRYLVEPKEGAKTEEEVQRREELTAILQQLYVQLIEPIRQFLPDSPEEVLTIIPHEELLHVPFGALQDAQKKYLIEKHTLVHAPAIRIFQYTRANTHRIPRSDHPTILAVVNPAPFPESRFTALDYTEKYFQDILHFYPDTQHNTLLRGDSATKTRLQYAAPHHAVLYFATHGEALEGEGQALDSYMALAAVSPEEDGYLRAADVFTYDLRAELVILAACKTGRGRPTGDGVLGLSRAFLSAGTSTLLMSLWSIPQPQTLEQMTMFHVYWKNQKVSKAHALRRAQLAALPSYADQPHIWAGFVIFGEWD